jgi:hypothetical protein
LARVDQLIVRRCWPRRRLARAIRQILVDTLRGQRRSFWFFDNPMLIAARRLGQLPGFAVGFHDLADAARAIKESGTP